MPTPTSMAVPWIRLTSGFVLMLLITGCGARTVVPLLSTAGVPLTRTPSRTIPLEVVTRSTSVKDPLPVGGSSIYYGDFETALGFAVSSAAVPWADAHINRRPEGWQLFVEMIEAEAEHDGSRLVVSIGVRATLRTRVGNMYLAQTEATCRDAGIVSAEGGGPVVYSCMMRLGRDLAGWLGAVEPEPRPASATTTEPSFPGAIGASGAGPADGPADGDGDGDSSSGSDSSD